MYRVCVAMSLLLGLMPRADAHHAWDPTGGTPIEWQARIERVSWDGPHVMYRIQVENAQQQLQSWQALGASPRILRGRGMAKSALLAGERVTVIGYLDPLTRLIGLKCLVAMDGRRYEMGFYPPVRVPAR